jgi:hypothetical protein
VCVFQDALLDCRLSEYVLGDHGHEMRWQASCFTLSEFVFLCWWHLEKTSRGGGLTLARFLL